MKKVLSLVLLLTLLIQLISLPVYSADVAIVGENETEFIRKLDIIGGWEASETVTRAEFVNAVMRCIIKNSGSKDGGVTVNAQNDVFADVPLNHWAAYNIELAKASGIISGADAGLFDPEGYLSYHAALKIIINALGYKTLADRNGGFPVGYIYAANEIKLGFLSVDNKEILTKGEAAILIKDMLETAPMKLEYMAEKNVYSIPNEWEDTLLNKIFYVRSFIGVVTANKYSSTEAAATQADKVCIRSLSNGNSGIFNVGETKAEEYLGRRVKVYYYTDNPYELLYIQPDDNNVLVIDSEDIIEADYTEKEIKYLKIKNNDWVAEKTEETINIDASIDIIHNGIISGNVKLIFDILNNETKYNLDSIVFYDNDNDNNFDTMKINTYYTIHVDYVYDDETRLVITDASLGISKTFDKTKKNVYINRYTSKGYRMDGYGIIVGDTVSVSEAIGDVELYSLYITKGSKSDTFMSYGDGKFISKDYTYTVSNTLLDHYTNISDVINLNEEYNLYLDHKGKIAGFYSEKVGYDTYYKIIKNKDEFIYIYNAGIDGRGLKKDIKIETINLEAEFNTMEVADKFRIDGVKVGSGSNCISPETACQMIKGKLVKYTKDANGKITSITFPKTQSNDNEFKYATGVNQTDGPVQLRYRATPKVFYKDGVGTASITSDTTILWVPHPELAVKGIDLNLYCKRGTTSNFTSDQYYYINSYTLNNTSVAADILIAYNNGEERIDSFTKPVIVTKVIQAKNNYGEYATKIFGMQENKEVQIASEQLEFKDKNGATVNVEPGDLVRCALNTKGDCVSMNMLYDHSDYVDISASYSSGYRAIRGSVYHHDKNIMLMVKNKWNIDDSDIKPSNLESQVCTSSAKIYVFNEKKKTLKKVTSGNLIDYKFDKTNYSRVVVANSYASPDLIVIYE